MQGRAAIGERFDIVGPDCDRAIMAFERLLIALEGVEQVAPIVVRLGVIGPQRNGAVETRQRVVATTESGEHIALECASTKSGRSAIARS